MPAPAENPPTAQSTTRSGKFPTQFSLKHLLWLTTAVAVGLGIFVTVPVLGIIVISILASAVQVGFLAFCCAGAWHNRGDRQLFYGVAAAAFLFGPHYSTTSDGILKYLTADAPIATDLLTAAWRISLSLFAGWLTVRAGRFWTDNEPSNSPPSAHEKS